MNIFKTLISSATLLLAVSGLVTSNVSMASSPLTNPLIHVSQTLQEGNNSDEAVNLILIPGLMSDASVWESTTQSLASKGNYNFHFIELAGFAGNRVNESMTIEAVTKEIVDYIEQQELNNTVIIGHSMGAFLAYKAALKAPESVSKVIAVDGLPFITPIFTRTNSSTAEQAQPFAQNLKRQYAQFNQSQLAEVTRQGVSIQARAVEDQEKVILMAAKSDPVTVGNIMAELMTTDLRSDLKTSHTPILLLGASGGFSTQEQHNFVEQLYSEQFDGVVNAEVRMNTQSRHFIMYDDLPWLVAQIDAFLSKSTAAQ